MITDYFQRPAPIGRLRAAPLGSYTDGFAGWLRESRYTRSTMRTKLQFVSRFNAEGAIQSLRRLTPS